MINRQNAPVPFVKPPLPFQDERAQITREDGWSFEHYDCGDNLVGCRFKILDNKKFARAADVYLHIEKSFEALLGYTQVQKHNYGLEEYQLLVDVYAYAISFFWRYCPEQHREVMFNLGRIIGVNPPHHSANFNPKTHQYIWSVCSCRHSRCDICANIKHIKATRGEIWFNQR